MRRFKKKTGNMYHKTIICIILGIVLITYNLLVFFEKNISKNAIQIVNTTIDNVISDTINDNVKTTILKKYEINELIEIHYSDNEISDIDYNLETAYLLMNEIKKNIMDSITINDAATPDYIEYYNDKLIIKIPFYNSLNNILVSQIGPKIIMMINIIQNMSGSIRTKVTTYGINTIKVELFINFEVKSSIAIPFNKENIFNSYDILISSKIIQGKVPTYYNGIIEEQSKKINI